VTNEYKFGFENSGIMFKNKVHTTKVLPAIKKAITLGEMLQTENIPDECFINQTQEAKFRYLKGSKKIPRVSKLGIKYNYSEGAMCFPDNLDIPGRTMLTSEGTINRSTHVVADIKTNKLRILTPIEAERLNQFPDNWTNTGMTSKKRYFMMGNALVCGIIKELGYKIKEIIEQEN
jgi:DNA (cytosine-5)-methyltransferase 1